MKKTKTKIDQIKNDCEELCNQLFDMINQMTNGSMSSYGKIKKHFCRLYAELQRYSGGNASHQNGYPACLLFLRWHCKPV